MGIFKDIMRQKGIEESFFFTVSLDNRGMVSFIEESLKQPPVINSALRAIRSRIESLPQHQHINMGLLKYESREIKSNRLIKLEVVPNSSNIFIQEFVEESNLKFDDSEKLKQIADLLLECSNNVVGTNEVINWKFKYKE